MDGWMGELYLYMCALCNAQMKIESLENHAYDYKMKCIAC